MSVSFTIDGKSITAQEGETILECALHHDIFIPNLCAYPNLPPSGACRMCIVEIEGMRGYPTSCTTFPEEGMVVQTNTPELQHLRKKLTELIFRETTTFGVRRQEVDRWCLVRRMEKVQTPYGWIDVKVGLWGDRVIKVSPEYESCRKLAENNNIALKSVYDAAAEAISHQFGDQWIK